MIKFLTLFWHKKLCFMRDIPNTNFAFKYHFVMQPFQAECWSLNVEEKVKTIIFLGCACVGAASRILSSFLAHLCARSLPFSAI